MDDLAELEEELQINEILTLRQHVYDSPYLAKQLPDKVFFFTRLL